LAAFSSPHRAGEFKGIPKTHFADFKVNKLN
jgi:hypothetical protein